MKRIFRSFLILTLLIVTGYVIVAHGLTYKVLGYRPYRQSLDRQHLAVVQTRFQAAAGSIATPTTLSQFAIAETAKKLSFALKYNSLSDPNKILDGKQAHCKMYAYVVAATYNQLAKERKWKTACRVAYGHVYLYGVNLHQFVGGAFFKDHDFCIFTDEQGVHAADAILYDYLLIDRIQLRK